MDQLSNFLAKYRRIVKGGADLKEIILTILKEKRISLLPEDLTLRGDTLNLRCNPVIRNEIFIRKAEILELINSKQNQYKFRDIKF